MRATAEALADAVRPAVAAVLAGAAVCAVLLAQNEQRPVFRRETALVYVDAYPRRDDRLVEGLEAADFQVFEDGKPQAVQAFQFIRFEPAPFDADRRNPSSLADSEQQAADPRNRVFVVYLDVYHLSRLGLGATQEPLAAFLESALASNDLFALTTPEIPVSRLTFGRSTVTLRSDLRALMERAHPDRADLGPIFAPAADEERISLCPTAPLARFRADRLYNSLEGIIVRLDALRDERKNLLLVSQGWSHPEGRSSASRRGSGPMLPPPITVVGGRIVRGDPRGPSAYSAWCQAETARLDAIDFAWRFRELVAAAERANVSFYTIDPEGLRTNVVSASTSNEDALRKIRSADPNGIREPMNTLLTLSGATDGHAVVNTNDISIGMNRIAERLSAYYLLGYYSTNPISDGKYRKIEVKVARPGVSVAARRGYMAAPSEATIATLRADAAARAGPVVAGAVTAELERLARLSGGLEVLAAGAVRADGLDVVVELAARELERGRWASGATVDVTATDTAGTVLTASGQIAAGTRGLRLRVPVAPDARGPWRVRARVTGDGPAAEDRIEVGAPDAALLGAPTAFRGNASTRVAPQPVAEFLFRRGERLRVEWPLVKPVEVQTARVLDRRGQPIGSAIPLAERDGEAGSRILGLDFALVLADGDYLLEVTATTGAETDVKLLAFRVGR